jgi:hypothetical protein
MYIGETQAAFSNLRNLVSSKQSLATGGWTVLSNLVAGNVTGITSQNNVQISISAEL